MSNSNLDLFGPHAAASVDIRMVESKHQVPVGISGLDRNFRYWGDGIGIPRGEYAIVGGKSGSGKTRFALHLNRQAIKAGEDSRLISMEMRQEDLFAQALMSISSIPYSSWLPSKWTKALGDKLVQEAAQFQAQQKAKATAKSLVDKPTLDAVMDEMEAARADGIKFIILDHLQLVKVPRISNIVDRAEEVSETVRQWAVSNKITVVGLSQLNRLAARNFQESPRMSDLWGGTSMESNAGIILLLDHTRMERDEQRLAHG